LVYDLLSVFEVAIAAEVGVDELGACFLAHCLGTVAFGSLEHVLFAFLEESLELLPEAFATDDEVLDCFLLLVVADAANTFLGSLHLTRQLDEEKPELARNIGDRSRGPMVEDRPIVDPLAERVGV